MEEVTTAANGIDPLHTCYYVVYTVLFIPKIQMKNIEFVNALFYKSDYMHINHTYTLLAMYANAKVETAEESMELSTWCNQKCSQ